MIIYDKSALTFYDTRKIDDLIFNGEITLCYTLTGDDITKGKKPSATPYIDRQDSFIKEGSLWVSKELGATLEITEIEKGVLLEICCERPDISELGLFLPFNFMGKLNGGGWENQFLLNSSYSENNITYAYLSKPNGNCIMACLFDGCGWKMDYSPYGWGHYFISLKLFKEFDKAYGGKSGGGRFKIGLFACDSFKNGLDILAKLYNLPFLSYELSGGVSGTEISLTTHGACDTILATQGGENVPLDALNSVKLLTEGEITLTPFYKGKKGALATAYCFSDIFTLYKKAILSIDLDTMEKHTDRNLCEHQCWISASIRFLLKYKDKLSAKEIKEIEKKIIKYLDIITENDESKATERITILNKPHDSFLAYNVYKSRRVQELFFGITILLDAYKYFKEEKYLTYLKGATNCLIDYYQRDDGHVEVIWENGECEDYTTVCCPIIPILDVANYFKVIDSKLSQKCFLSADKMAEYVYKRGMLFPTEGGRSKECEMEMEDGSISCSALLLLYYCKNRKTLDTYLKKAKEILDIHKSWVINTPICQMYNSSLRWWETQWEGDGDGPAICAGHAWSIWRGEADLLYYLLSGDKNHLLNAKNTFMTNLSKIQSDGTTYAIYNPDMINGGGFHSFSEEISHKIATKFPKTPDCGLSRYVFLRLSQYLGD